MQKPVYTPIEQIETSLYTIGKEWMIIDTNEEYIGLYHKYPNGAVYTEAVFFDNSIELIPYVQLNINSSIYFKLTGARFNNYINPKYYYLFNKKIIFHILWK